MLSVLTAAAATQSPGFGGLLLLIFGLGRAIPLFLAGVSADVARGLATVAPHIPKVEKAFGLVFLALAGYYLYQFWRVVRAIL